MVLDGGGKIGVLSEGARPQAELQRVDRIGRVGKVGGESEAAGQAEDLQWGIRRGWVKSFIQYSKIGLQMSYFHKTSII